jgi:hypothetical protein
MTLPEKVRTSPASMRIIPIDRQNQVKVLCYGREYELKREKALIDSECVIELEV